MWRVNFRCWLLAAVLAIAAVPPALTISARPVGAAGGAAAANWCCRRDALEAGVLRRVGGGGLRGVPANLGLRGGEGAGPGVVRTRSVIEKEKLNADPMVDSAGSFEGAAPPENAGAGAGKPKAGGQEPEKKKEVPAPLVAQRVSKLASRYEVDFGESGVLGTGTFSTVRVATHRQSGIRYAVKAISLLDIHHQTLVRLRREIQILQNLSHPNIISLYEIFEENNTLYMVMEMCTGGELWHFLQRVEIYPNGEKFYMTNKGKVPLTEEKVASIVKQMVDAVAYCHERHVAHRDLKLENLMLAHSGEEAAIKLIDFGFCKVFHGENDMRAVLGSPYYVAPEVLQARGPGSVNQAKGYGSPADMWSIGVITFMVLCGQAPFDGNDDTERLKAVKRGVFSYPVTAALSANAVSFVNGLLQMNPAKRMTAKAALNHPWLRGTKSARTPKFQKWSFAQWD